MALCQARLGPAQLLVVVLDVPQQNMGRSQPGVQAQGLLHQFLRCLVAVTLVGTFAGGVSIQLISVVEVDLGQVFLEGGVLSVQTVGLLHLAGGFFPVALIALFHGVIVVGNRQLMGQIPVSRL